MARIAGEAFTMITGIDLVANNLRGAPPEGFRAGPSDDPADDLVALDPDENLSFPDVARVRAKWRTLEAELPRGPRYVFGKPIASRWLERVLRSETQRRRAHAAIDLALLEPGKPLFEVRAPGMRQVEDLRIGPE
jgi:uncharacterized protein (TIGR02270 family)